jgi:predicted restriction endonuclease
MGWERTKASVSIGLATDADLPERFLQACSQVARIRELDEADLDHDSAGEASSDGSSTTAHAIQKARIGQGLFRNLVLAQWGGVCAVTHCNWTSLLIAGHIKPWATDGITDAERLDPMNGIPLVPSLAVVFDRGYITFTEVGNMVVSKRVDADARAALGLVPGMRLQTQPKFRMASYLAYHRQYVFQDRK